MTMRIFVVLSMLIAMGISTNATFVCDKDGMFENTNDLGTFWHCAHGIGYLKQCPSTLIWSQQVQNCVWNGKCSCSFVIIPDVVFVSTNQKVLNARR